MAIKNESLHSDRISQVEDVVLRCFFPEGREITIKKIQDRCSYSYERVNTALKQLTEKKIISEKKIGKTLTYSLDFHHLYSKLAFYRFMTEKIIKFSNKHKKIFRAIKELEEEPFDIIILFGSYSKGTETMNSDIDLMIIANTKNRENQVYGLKHKYNLDFAPVFVKKEEFPKIKKENKVLWESLRDFGVVFKGENLFYYRMYQNEND